MTQAFDIVRTPLEKGTLLLEASAGTGKTWSITSIAVRLLLEEVGTVEEILLVTFTRKATDELRHRLRDRLHRTELVLRGKLPETELVEDQFLQHVARKWGGDAEALARIATARRDVDLARVRTIHSFCNEVLAEGAFDAAMPLDGAQPAAADELVEMAWRDALRDFVLGHPPIVASALKAWELNQVRIGQVRTALREAHNHWVPEERAFGDVLADFTAKLETLDFGLLGSFGASVPAKAWVKDGREKCLPLIEVLGNGLDSDRDDHRAALFKLSHALMEKGLGKRNARLLHGTGLESMLLDFDEALAAFRAGLFQNLYRRAIERYGAIKERLALIDYDDVIAQTRARLMSGEGGDRLARRIGRSFRAALVDEFQDTDGDQWDVFRKIFTAAEGEASEHVLVLVGDPKQAIYRFRGADIYAYLGAADAATRKRTLTRNWRSTPGLVAAVNSVFGRRARESFGLDRIPFTPVEAARPADEGVPMQVVWVETTGRASKARTERAVLARLAADVLTRRTEVPVGEGRQLAVLVQEHRQARAVRDALRRVGLNVVLARGGDIHDSEAMREWRVILRALLDPSDIRMQRRARATRLWGTTLAGLGAESTGFEDVELLARLRRVWTDEGVAALSATLLGERDTVHRVLGEEDGERFVTDLRHGVELLNRAEAERGLGPEALLRWAEAEARSDDPQSEERPLRLDRQSDAVQVLTNFTSKGLEFDTVFLPFAWHRRAFKGKPPLRVHDDDRRSIFEFMEDSPWQDQALLEEVASDLRMHYVELTRAKERCVVYLSPNPTYFPYTAAAFLLARPDADAGDDRATWMRQQRDLLEGSVKKAREAVAKRLENDAAIAFRVDDDESIMARPVPAPEVLAPEALDFPDARRPCLVPWRQLSYTALVHALHERLEVDPVELPLTDRADPSDAPAAGSGTGIFGFARGARAGICLHELLEKSDFTRAVDADDGLRVRKLLARHGLDQPSEHPGDIDPVEVCLELIEQVRCERLPFGGERFSALTGDERLDEWQFNLPVVDLVPSRIAGLVRKHWAHEEWIVRAADRLARLPATKLQGMLGGFVDLLFTDGERWVVLDWKSNDLGPAVGSYTQAAMHRAMVEHDYVVQLLFYLVAAHRFLRTRLAGYDYDRHVAGASYVFLRGLCGDDQYGWCNVAPPRALIEAIDELFAGGGS